jgi:hypothetical protein
VTRSALVVKRGVDVSYVRLVTVEATSKGPREPQALTEVQAQRAPAEALGLRL